MKRSGWFILRRLHSDGLVPSWVWARLLRKGGYPWVLGLMCFTYPLGNGYFTYQCHNDGGQVETGSGYQQGTTQYLYPWPSVREGDPRPPAWPSPPSIAPQPDPWPRTDMNRGWDDDEAWGWDGEGGDD